MGSPEKNSVEQLCEQISKFVDYWKKLKTDKTSRSINFAIISIILTTSVTIIAATNPFLYDEYVFPFGIYSPPTCDNLEKTQRYLDWFQFASELIGILLLGSAAFSATLSHRLGERLEQIADKHRKELENISEDNKDKALKSIRNVFDFLDKNNSLFLRVINSRSLYLEIRNITNALSNHLQRITPILIVHSLISAFPGGILGLFSFTFFALSFCIKSISLFHKTPLLNLQC